MLRYLTLIFVLVFGWENVQAAPSYAPDEIVVQYGNNSMIEDVQHARALYGVTSVEVIIPNVLEIWTGLSFPRQAVNPDLTTANLLDIVDLLVHLNENSDGNNGGSQSSRARVNDSDLQYYFDAVPLQDIPTGPLGPPIDCPTENHRIIGTPDLNSSNVTTIVMLDQLMTAHNYFPNITSTIPIVMDNNGTHGNKVASVIKHTLDAAGMNDSDYEFISYGVFFDDGTASYANLLRALIHLCESGVSDAVLNLSASAEIIASEESQTILRNYLAPRLVVQNLILVTSVGNNGAYSDFIYPASTMMSNQISVAGSMNCFASPWSNTNRNHEQFSIVAEAEQLLTYDGANYYLSDGTSYATPLVTAAIAQVHSQYTTFNAALICDKILSKADQVSAFYPVVQYGRVLNVTEATAPSLWGVQTDQTLTDNAISSPSVESKLPQSAVVITPNPVVDQFTITWPDYANDQAVNAVLYSLEGRVVAEKTWASARTLNWQLPPHLPPGSYLLSVGSATVSPTTQLLIKH